MPDGMHSQPGKAESESAVDQRDRALVLFATAAKRARDEILAGKPTDAYATLDKVQQLALTILNAASLQAMIESTAAAFRAGADARDLLGDD